MADDDVVTEKKSVLYHYVRVDHSFYVLWRKTYVNGQTTRMVSEKEMFVLRIGSKWQRYFHGVQCEEKKLQLTKIWRRGPGEVPVEVRAVTLLEARAETEVAQLDVTARVQ